MRIREAKPDCVHNTKSPGSTSLQCQLAVHKQAQHCMFDRGVLQAQIAHVEARRWQHRSYVGDSMGAEVCSLLQKRCRRPLHQQVWGFAQQHCGVRVT